MLTSSTLWKSISGNNGYSSSYNTNSGRTPFPRPQISSHFCTARCTSSRRRRSSGIRCNASSSSSPNNTRIWPCLQRWQLVIRIMGLPRPQHKRTPSAVSSSSRDPSTRTSRTRCTYPRTRAGCRPRRARQRAASVSLHDRRRHTPTPPRRRLAQALHPRRRAVSVATTVLPSALARPRRHLLPASPRRSQVRRSSRKRCFHRRRRKQITSNQSRSAAPTFAVGTRHSVRQFLLYVKRFARKKKPSEMQRAGSVQMVRRARRDGQRRDKRTAMTRRRTSSMGEQARGAKM